MYLYIFNKAWKKDCAKVHSFIDGCIARHLRSAADNKNTSEQQKRYVLVEGMATKFRDPVELRFELLSIFVPAYNSTAMATANILFSLARNPHVWTELRKQALALGDQPVTFELLKSLPAFRYTVYEGIRLHCPVNHSRRGGGPDGLAPAFVAKGRMVYVNNFPTMYDPKIWGDDIEAFRPARFEGKLLNWDFTPFFGGPRICPANQQVLSQIIYLLVRLVREFETIENRDPCVEYVEYVRMCMESRNGCKVALRPAQGV